MGERAKKNMSRGKSSKDMREKVILQDDTTTGTTTSTNLSTKETTVDPGSPTKTDQKDVPIKATIVTDHPPTVALKSILPELSPDLRAKKKNQTFLMPRNLKIKKIKQKKNMVKLNKGKLLRMKVKILKVTSDGSLDYIKIVRLTEKNTRREKDLDQDQVLLSKIGYTPNHLGRRSCRWKVSEILETINNESLEISKIAAENQGI
jgi:hypothetical protein